MNLNHRIEKALMPLGFLLAALVIVAGTLRWPLVVVYALTALMFGAVFGARSVERRSRRER